MGLRETLERLAEPDLTGDPRVAVEFDAAVLSLFEAVEGWLPSIGQDGSVAPVRSRTVLREQGFPPRGIPVLDLVAAGRQVALRPIGAFVAGARGRVDMASAKGDGTTVRILLDPKGLAGWCVADPEGQSYAPLDEAAFLRILGDLVGPAPEAGPGA